MFEVGDKVRAKDNCNNDIANCEGIIYSIDRRGNMEIKITKRGRGYNVGDITLKVDWGKYLELINPKFKVNARGYI